MKRSLWFTLIMLGAGALSACGPIGYHYSVSLKAAQALAEAKAANAEKLAPYEYWSAVTYLKMAREKAPTPITRTPGTMANGVKPLPRKPKSSPLKRARRAPPPSGRPTHLPR